MESALLPEIKDELLSSVTMNAFAESRQSVIGPLNENHPDNAGCKKETLHYFSINMIKNHVKEQNSLQQLLLREHSGLS